MPPVPERYTLTLIALPGFDTPGVQRLKMALKRLRRDYGLACSGCVPAITATVVIVPPAGEADPVAGSAATVQNP